MKLTILGGGLAGISLAYFLQDNPEISSIDILEKESEPGGLCRSFIHDDIVVDIGPHIFFSKDKNTLDLMLNLLGENKHELRRSNRIIHKGKLVQYPFENDLSKLPREDCKKCVDGFLNNPYRDYNADNMLQFFLKTFGEGITNLYLRPYNEKIWKFDPSFMDTQMVERIPRPPEEDILRSASGETVDGYTHQLYFSYPKKGGMGSFIQALIKNLNKKVRIHTSKEVTNLCKLPDGWRTDTNAGSFLSEQVVSCLPVNILAEIYEGAENEVKKCASDLKYNNIIIAVATVSVDRAGDNFAFMVADRDVIFHRISKIDFLGSSYSHENKATYMMEYTYRNDDPKKDWSNEELRDEFTKGLKKIGFINSEEEVLDFTAKKFPYAYIIYDLNHKKNMAFIREYFNNQGILLNGRFGNFEYWNMDKVVAQSRITADRFLDIYTHALPMHKNLKEIYISPESNCTEQVRR